MTTLPPTTHPSQSECFTPAATLHPHRRTRRDLSSRTFSFTLRSQCGCVPGPDWLRAARLRAQAPPRLLRAGVRRGRRGVESSHIGRSLAALAMPNRKASRNAYYFFVQEKIPELRRRGLPVARVADAVPYCSADWAVRLASVGRAVGNWEGEAEGTATPWPLLGW